jgi:hypothetical protein
MPFRRRRININTTIPIIRRSKTTTPIAMPILAPVLKPPWGVELSCVVEVFTVGFAASEFVEEAALDALEDFVSDPKNVRVVFGTWARKAIP